jgi:hypothetical protein
VRDYYCFFLSDRGVYSSGIGDNREEFIQNLRTHAQVQFPSLSPFTNGHGVFMKWGSLVSCINENIGIHESEITARDAEGAEKIVFR